MSDERSEEQLREDAWTYISRMWDNAANFVQVDGEGDPIPFWDLLSYKSQEAFIRWVIEGRLLSDFVHAMGHAAREELGADCQRSRSAMPPVEGLP